MTITITILKTKQISVPVRAGLQCGSGVCGYNA
ncbi:MULTISPECIES: methanobactin [Acetobacteraceae]|uniref:Methanobactin n=5 Tax=Acetobacteraceae TaxID=433 RepID=A0ABS5SL66_9PROT|nr:methanobactin [Komagataeibacter medellinensis]MBL7238294.1 methanobactin [Novacetimonas hansenii]MBT0674527.1 methanobactin [Komagataeibacter oboediens]PAK76731.1 hypothetical protein B8X00_13410 [Acetobacter fabarum]PYD55550.1 methanobactin [Komagataeibacter xylinus]QEE86214.1 methanobactin [Acetobacter oryzoeni]